MKRIPIKFEQNITGVYIIECIVNGLVYIGSSINIRARWNQHICSLNKGTHGNSHLQNAWNTYGECSFEFSILDLCERTNLQDFEQKYLDLFKSYNRNFGFNIAEKAFLPPMTEESRKKQSESLKSNTDFINKSRNFMKELHKDPIRKQHLIDSIKSSQKVKDNLKKLNQSEEHKKQVQELLKMIHNDPRIQEHVRGMAQVNRLNSEWRQSHGVKNVAQYDLDGNFLHIFRSLGEVQSTLSTPSFKIDRSGIAACCNGKRDSYKGFIWEYVEDENYEDFIQQNQN